MMRNDAHKVPAARAELGCAMLILATGAGQLLVFLAAIVGLGKPALALLGLLPLMALVLWPVLSLFHRGITIGDDGVRLSAWRSDPFHSWADITRVSWVPGGWGKIGQLFPWLVVVLHHANGKDTILWGLRPRMEWIYKESAARLDRYNRLKQVDPPAALRAPIAESQTRLEALRQLGSAEVGSLRAAPIDRSSLMKVALSAGCQAADRAAAAVALARGADETERWNLRAAAGASAHPKLRILVDQALEEQLEAEALEEAMVELAACDPRVR